MTGIDEAHVYLGHHSLPASVVLWGAGVAASPLGKLLGAPTDRAGRVQVQPDLTLPGHPEVFVLGDMAVLARNGKPGSRSRSRCNPDGTIRRRLHLGRTTWPGRKTFRYWDKGTLATIGRSSAVADIGGFKLSGFIAWFLWLFVHLLFLIGFRNRMQVLWEWFWPTLLFSGAHASSPDNPLYCSSVVPGEVRPGHGRK